MSEHEDSGEYVYLLAGDPAKMLEALSDPDGSPLIPATNQRNRLKQPSQQAPTDGAASNESER